MGSTCMYVKGRQILTKF